MLFAVGCFSDDVPRTRLSVQGFAEALTERIIGEKRECNSIETRMLLCFPYRAFSAPSVMLGQMVNKKRESVLCGFVGGAMTVF
jgi:hypothetical protein